MKKSVLAVLVLALVCGWILAGCSKKDEQKVNIGGATVVVGDEVDWPAADFGGLGSPGGKVTGLIEGNGDSITAVIEELNKEDVENYIADLKAKGYEQQVQMKDEDMLMYTGKNQAGKICTIIYTIEDKTATIAYLQETEATTEQIEETTEEQDETDEVEPTTPESTEPTATEEPDLADATDWPSDRLEGVEELAGKISGVMTMEGIVTITVEYVEEEDLEKFIESLKANGYTQDAQEVKSSDTYYYYAAHENGDTLQLGYSYTDKLADIFIQTSVDED